MKYFIIVKKGYISFDIQLIYIQDTIQIQLPKHQFCIIYK